MNMNKASITTPAITIGLLVLFGTGCSSTLKLSGTPGAQFTGRYTAGGVGRNVSGTLPATFRASGGRLESCEFRKAAQDQELILVVHRGLFTGSVAAPPGTAGVRAERKGILYEMETLP